MRWQRPGEQESLTLVAAEFAQPPKLIRGLDPLGDRSKAEVGCQINDRRHDALVRRILADALNEGLVDLDETQRQAAKVRERRIAGAEVVEADLDAELPDLFELAKDVGPKIDDHRLGQFEVQAGRIETRVFKSVVNNRREVTRLELPRREIDGDCQRGARERYRMPVDRFAARHL